MTTDKGSFCEIFTNREASDGLEALILNRLPTGNIRKILIKPNLVAHESNPSFPIEAKVTDPKIILAIIKACLQKYPEMEMVTIGDAPLQSCDWDLMLKQAGYTEMFKEVQKLTRGRVKLSDFRLERATITGGLIERKKTDTELKSENEVEVQLDAKSFLDPISSEKGLFRVADYSPTETISNHKRGFHRYLIAHAAIDCDLFINVPKLKVHQKAGLTAALKNLVGINASKANLVHYRRSGSKTSGDEFPQDRSHLVVAHIRVKEFLQRVTKPVHRILYRPLKLTWRTLAKISKLDFNGYTRGTPNLGRSFVTGGAWYGNDTIWRMIYDLNKIVRYCPPAGGRLASTTQRQYLVIVDGFVAGEGNGPLEALPVDLGLFLISNDPFLCDISLATLVGFDYSKIPTFRRHREFADDVWGNFDPGLVEITINGERVSGVDSLPVLKNLIPSVGWKGHIELK